MRLKEKINVWVKYIDRFLIARPVFLCVLTSYHNIYSRVLYHVTQIKKKIKCSKKIKQRQKLLLVCPGTFIYFYKEIRSINFFFHVKVIIQICKMFGYVFTLPNVDSFVDLHFYNFPRS